MDAVAGTSRWVAAIRALESERQNALFHDLLARPLAGEEGFAMLREPEPGDLIAAGRLAYIAIRTRFFDDFILRARAEGVRQVVLVAAGMDARAYRLDWPAGTHLFELDRPDLLALKQQILDRESARPRCERVTVGVDLEREWTHALLQAGFDAGRPALWLVEGLVHYLPEQSVRGLLERISSLAAPGSRLGLDCVSQTFLTSPWTQEARRQMDEQGIGWRFGTNDPRGLLAQFGWDAAVTRPGDEGAHFGRWPYPPMPDLPDLPQSFLVTATKT